MNMRAIALGALAGLVVQLVAGITMGVLWAWGNTGATLAGLAAAALVSAFTASLVASISSRHREITHGIAAILLLAFGNSVNSVFTGSFDPIGILVGTTIALGTGSLAAGVVVLARRSKSSGDDQDHS